MPGTVSRPLLVQELSKDVIAVLSKDHRLQAKLGDIASKGRKALNDLQLQQERHNVALGRAVDACLKSQSAFQEENQKILGAVQALLGMLVPNAFGTAQSSWTYWPCQATNYYNGLAPYLNASSDGSFSFTVTLRKADGSSLGLAIAHAEGDEALLVEGVVPGGAVEAWNRQCAQSFGQPHKVVQPGDKIIAVNGISKDTVAMLKECGAKPLSKITILRESQVATGIAGQLQQHTPAVSGMRTDAPEFVPAVNSQEHAVAATDAEDGAAARAVVQSVPQPPPGLLHPRRLWATEGSEDTLSDNSEEKDGDDSFIL